MARKLFCAFLLSQFLSVSIARLKNPCFEFETCDSCISHRLCRWVVNIVTLDMIQDNYLLSPDTQRGRKQCVLRDTRTQFNPADVYDPISSSKDSGEIQTADINIKPTSVTLDLSAGKQTEFKVSVQPLRMEKLKIYFLVHLSSDFSRVLSTMSPLIEEIGMKIIFHFSYRS
ncbi:hypothetical protein RF11_06379 [Thelohanellus kitauei]|uniref:Uncharacterized protein n=1 Tax=Thelohanellus kitauei TaxID=669202 RepID=A0A0C2MM38_THEKT|nr:hypothetical protein RF11_06379 [Thelohanellus kitauei]